MTVNKTERSRWSVKSIFGTFAILGMAAAPFMSSMGSSNHTPYRTDSGELAICFGHTKNVKMSDIATDEQCQKYLEDDMAQAIVFVIQHTPGIVTQHNVLKAAGHFTITQNEEAYLTSPMLAYFRQGEWEKGCHAFTGYRTHYRYKFKRFGYDCNQLKDGSWSCEIPELVMIRKKETQLCLSK